MAHVHTLSSIFGNYGRSLYQRSLAIPPFLTQHMTWIAVGWIAFAGLAAALRIAFPASAVHQVWDTWPMLLAYSAIIAAPISAYLLTRSAFSGKSARRPLDFHLSFVGKWQRVSPEQATSHPMFGPVGFLASLLVGLLLNVVIRSGEFFLAVPAMSVHAPEWAMTMFIVMALDVIVMNFFYMVAFVMALRSIPLFPRMLLFVWLTDIIMQLAIADRIAQIGSLPSEVVEPLVILLDGNLNKVAISIMIWLPYLLLSDRVNVTYRSRLPG